MRVPRFEASWKRARTDLQRSLNSQRGRLSVRTHARTPDLHSLVEGDSLLPIRTCSVFALENGTHHRDRNVRRRILVEYSVPVVRVHGANVVRQRVVSTRPCQLIQNKQQSSLSQPPASGRTAHYPTLTPLQSATRCCCAVCFVCRRRRRRVVSHHLP